MDSTPSETRPSSSATADAPGARTPTVLVVDDDELFVELLSDEFRPHFLVEWARDGGTALSAVGRQAPDVIFIDQGLPDIAGVRLIDEIRKAGCETPVVMLTASQDVRVAAAAMRAGAVDFVVKDINEHFYEDIVPTAIRAIEKWNNEKELDYLREQQITQAEQTNLLNRELQARNDQLRRAYRDLEASQQQLHRKNRRLSELYETAHRFVDNVSHEMRTPLTVIKEFVSIILDGLAGQVSEQQAEYLSICADKTNDLAQMVDDMLDISKLEAGLLRVERVASHFHDIVESVRHVLQQKLEGHHIQLTTELEDDLPCLYFDPEKIGRVLINLVVNAIKFSPENSKIRICARRGDQADEVVVEVFDEGPGIAAEHLDVIFERFRQVGERCRNSTKGFGIGLNIVRELANLNLGDVSVTSELGVGSCFSFTIPVYDHALLIQRYLRRRDTFGHHGDRIAFVRAFALRPTSGTAEHIRAFVVQHLAPYDLAFERSDFSDVIVVALTNDAEAIVRRLREKNAEELRLSPGSTVSLDFEVLRDQELDDSEFSAAKYFESLFDRPVEHSRHAT